MGIPTRARQDFELLLSEAFLQAFTSASLSWSCSCKASPGHPLHPAACSQQPAGAPLPHLPGPGRAPWQRGGLRPGPWRQQRHPGRRGSRSTAGEPLPGRPPAQPHRHGAYRQRAGLQGKDRGKGREQGQGSQQKQPSGGKGTEPGRGAGAAPGTTFPNSPPPRSRAGPGRPRCAAPPLSPRPPPPALPCPARCPALASSPPFSSAPLPTLAMFPLG